LRRAQNDAIRRHKAIRNLRAKATIMVLRVPRAFSVRARNHFAKALPFWNMRNRHANWIMPAAIIEKMHSGVALTDEDRWPWLKAIGAGRRSRASSAADGGAMRRRGGLLLP
jgi:hypothetical protein